MMEKSSINSRYHPPKWLFNTHLETIYPALFRKVSSFPSEKVTIPTRDDDFLELDHYHGFSAKRVIILCHGLEGDSKSAYMCGMANHFNQNGWDAIAWNYRGCGEKLNDKPVFYHSGATNDLDDVVHYAANKYTTIFLSGFSLGGNLILKYLGERNDLPNNIVGSAVFSVPLHLYSCSLKMGKTYNYIYAKRFLRKLAKKIREKEKARPGTFDLTRLKNVKTLIEFDDYFTAPLHGFKNAVDYYEKCSALYFLENIQVPSLMINARNDTFLSDKCFDRSLFSINRHLHYLITDRGGHVGFSLFNNNSVYWSELQAMDFANKLTSL